MPNKLVKDNNDIARQASIDLWGRMIPDAILRSITATYNCVGMVVACRRSHVHPIYLRTVLMHDGYSQISRPQAVIGDLVIYGTDDDPTTHVGVIASKEVIFDPYVPTEW